MTIAVTTTKTGFDATGDPVASATEMTYANSVDNLFNNILNGVQPFDKQLFSAATTLQENGGTTHIIGVPTTALVNVSAATGTVGFLKTIGVSNNRFVVLKASSGHTIAVVADGTGNITSIDGGNIILSGDRTALLYCLNSQWGLIGSSAGITGNGLLSNFSAAVDPTPAEDSVDGYGVGSQWVNTAADRGFINVDATPDLAIWKPITPPKNRWAARAGGATAVGAGIANPTTANAPANANDAVNTFMTLPTTAAAGNLGGWVTTSFNLIRPSFDPAIEIYIKTSADLSAQRDWIGLISADITNVDDPAAGTKFIGFRYSSVAVDPGWMPVLDDGTTMNVGTALGGAIAINTVYKMKIRLVSGGTPTAYFSVNDSAEQAMQTNFPAIATDMGAIVRCIATTAAIRSLSFSSFDVRWG
jgi:hypothetical protein